MSASTNTGMASMPARRSAFALLLRDPAAVLAGAYQDFPNAQKKMTSVQAKSYRPIAANRKIYNQLYTLYRTTHDAFGGVDKSSDLSRVMKDLLALKSAAHA